MADFDQLDRQKRSGQPLSPEQTQQNESLQTLAGERMNFAREHPALHELMSGQAKESPIHQHLEAHLKGTEFGSVFTKSEVFPSPEAIIGYAEQALGEAYKGKLQPGGVIHGEQNGVAYELTLLPSNAIEDGLSVGSSAPGGRVILRAEFQETIGERLTTERERMSLEDLLRSLGYEVNEQPSDTAVA